VTKPAVILAVGIGLMAHFAGGQATPAKQFVITD